MTKKIVFLLFLFFTEFTFSQDLIILKDGIKIEAKIVEITSTSIRFYKFTQLEGPIRIAEKYEVSEIIYQNGESEKFDLNNSQSELSEPLPNLTNKIEPQEDPIFKNGRSLEGFIGMTQFHYERNFSYYDNTIGQTVPMVETLNPNYLTFGFNYHRRWYFGKHEKFRVGIHMNWIRFGIHLENGNFEKFLVGARTISPFHFGLCGIYKFNDKMAVDANVNFGPTLSADIDNDIFVVGPSLTIESRLRMKKVALGLVYQYYKLDDGVGEENPRRFMIGNSLALSISKKF